MMNDLRYALRMLCKHPGFTLVVILTLALGIGANTAVFSVVHAVLLRPLPLPEPERLVQVWETQEMPADFLGTASEPNLRDWRAQNSVFDGLAAYHFQNFALQDRESPERALGAKVSTDYFRLLGARPLLGRGFLSGEDGPGHDDVVVLSESLWRTRYAADAGIVGRQITLDDRRVTVVGVMPADFRFPSGRARLWAPLVFSAADLAARGNHRFWVVGRLRAGVALSQAQAQMGAIAQTLARQYPDNQAGRGIKLVPLREELVGKTRPALLVLLGAVSCVLLIACANIANLLLAHNTSRGREMALRLALGASRWRLTRQLLIESFLLATLGGAAGILAATWGIDLLVALAREWLPRTAEVRLDGAVLGFSCLLTLLVGLICGLVPARQGVGCAATDLQATLREAIGAGGAGRGRLRGALVVAEMALAMMLLAGAGLLLRSFAQVYRTDSGLGQAENVLTARVSLPAGQYPTSAAVTAFYERALPRLAALPGVRAVGTINLLPLSQWGTNGDVEVEGRAPAAPGQAPLAEFRVIGGDYLAAAGIPLLAGRPLDARDAADAPAAVLINRTMARRFWKDEADALGKRVKAYTETFSTIVGVVADVRQTGLDRAPEPEVYFPVAQAPHASGPGENEAQAMNLVVRAAAGEPTALSESVRRAVREIDPALPVFDPRPLRAVIAESVADRRLHGLLLGAFAATALLLAALGLYGVMSYTVAQRTREMGIRLALGAQPAALMRLVVGQSLRLALLGLALGLVAALGVTRLLGAMLYGVSPIDPTTLASVSGLLLLVAALAGYLPARRAGRVDPMVALREG